MPKLKLFAWRGARPRKGHPAGRLEEKPGEPTWPCGPCDRCRVKFLVTQQEWIPSIDPLNYGHTWTLSWWLAQVSFVEPLCINGCQR